MTFAKDHPAEHWHEYCKGTQCRKLAQLLQISILVLARFLQALRTFGAFGMLIAKHVKVRKPFV
jgi:hypothetical protein